MKTVYMDHTATAPMSEAALAELIRCTKETFGNPSAVYSHGQQAKNTLENARRRMANLLGGLSTEVFFTSGGTESDNWALRGVAKLKGSGHILVSAMEHNAVLRTAEQLEADGFSVTRLKPDRFGQIQPEALEAAIRPDTVLVSIMAANNVVGTLQDIPALARIAHRHGALFHTDAVQAVGSISLNARKWGVDLLSLSAHKFGGPKGVGALYCRLPLRIPPLIYGGGQEKGERSGTENVPGIAAMVTALEERLATLPESTAYLTQLREQLVQGSKRITGMLLTGHPQERLPGLASFVVAGIAHSVYLVNALNERGFCVSSGSACSASSREASHVLEAMGYEDALTGTSLRISLGVENTAEEVDALLEALKELVPQLQKKYPAQNPF